MRALDSRAQSCTEGSGQTGHRRHPNGTCTARGVQRQSDRIPGRSAGCEPQWARATPGRASSAMSGQADRCRQPLRLSANPRISGCATLGLRVGARAFRLHSERPAGPVWAASRGRGMPAFLPALRRASGRIGLHDLNRRPRVPGHRLRQGCACASSGERVSAGSRKDQETGDHDGVTIPEMLLAQAERVPRDTAIEAPGRTPLSYAALWQAVNACAAQLPGHRHSTAGSGRRVPAQWPRDGRGLPERLQRGGLRAAQSGIP